MGEYLNCILEDNNFGKVVMYIFSEGYFMCLDSIGCNVKDEIDLVYDYKYKISDKEYVIYNDS